MTIEHDENLEAAYYSVCKQRDSDAREAERLLADVHRLINDRAEECRAKEEALREAERLRAERKTLWAQVDGLSSRPDWTAYNALLDERDALKARVTAYENWDGTKR
jgi:hypothetical protein